MSESGSVAEVVLTGGPCAGKTSALAYLQQKLSDYGFRVFILPELATMLTLGGIQDIGDLYQRDYPLYLEVERHFLTMQQALRRQYRSLAGEFAGRGERCVIIADRAECDIAAYLKAGEFEALLEEEKLTWHDVRDSYAGVIHLRTVAEDRPELYTQANNDARRETADQAVEADNRTLAAWIGHPRLRIVGNATSFDSKIRRVLAVLTREIGLPVPLEVERKFLLRTAPELNHPTIAAGKTVEIEQTYLLADDPAKELRVRKRAQHGQASYYRTEKIRRSTTVREERSEIITPREYLRLLESRDPAREPIIKRRHNFVWQNQYFELDEFCQLPELFLLEVELTEENDTLKLPPFLDIEREVTDDLEYGNAHLAKIIANKSRSSSANQALTDAPA